MPYLNGPGCLLGECDPPVFPTVVEPCINTPSAGGISELYFIPCTATFSEANITDPYWWAAFIDGGTLGRSGAGLGSLAKKSSTSERFSSCKTEQVTQFVWALTFVKKYFDKTSARLTCAVMNEILLNSGRYLLIARMCEGDETVLPIGIFNASDGDWTVPDNFQENQSMTLELSWIELGFPCTVDVPGLAAILPKPAA